MIEIESLTKRYRRTLAVDHLSLQVPEGSIFGLIGRNGAGKTTTMRIVSTLLLPTAGRVTVGGFDVVRRPRDVRRILGYMPDFFGIYDDLKVTEYLDFYAAAQGVPVERRGKIVSDLLELVDLAHKREDYVDHLSRGMKQRLCLARALVHDPAVLVLDEPASGLDPRARIEMRGLLRELRTMGKTVLISSHILSELADLCTHVGIVEGGRVVIAGPIDEVLYRRATTRRMRLRVAEPEQVAEAEAVLRRAPAVSGVERAPLGIEFDLAGDDHAMAALLGELVAAGVSVATFGDVSNTLEDLFLQSTREAEGGAA